MKETEFPSSLTKPVSDLVSVAKTLESKSKLVLEFRNAVRFEFIIMPELVNGHVAFERQVFEKDIPFYPLDATVYVREDKNLCKLINDFVEPQLDKYFSGTFEGYKLKLITLLDTTGNRKR